MIYNLAEIGDTHVKNINLNEIKRKIEADFKPKSKENLL